MKHIVIFLIGCVFGALLLDGVLAIKEGAYGMKSLESTDVYSDVQVRQRIKESGIDLPSASWNLFYAINGFQDHAVWISLTVPHDQLWEVVEASLHKQRQDFISGIPEEFLKQVETGTDQKLDASLWSPDTIKNPLHYSIRRGDSYFEDWVVDEEGGRMFITKQNT